MNLLTIYYSEFDMCLRSQEPTIKNGLFSKVEVEALHALRDLNPLINFLSKPISKATGLKLLPVYGFKYFDFDNKFIGTINLEVVDALSKTFELELKETKHDIVFRELAPYFQKIIGFAEVIDKILDQHSKDDSGTKSKSTAYRLKSEDSVNAEDIALDNTEDLKIFELVLKLSGYGSIVFDAPSCATIIKFRHKNELILNEKDVFVREIKIDDLSKNKSLMEVHFSDQKNEVEFPATIKFNPAFFETLSKRFREPIRVKMISSRLTIYRRMKHPNSYDLVEILN